MFKETLEEIGLSPNEAKIYEALVTIGQANVPQIAVKTKIHKRNIYDTIPRLLNKGLIYQIASSRDNEYAAVEPSKLEDIIWEKQNRLENILPALNAQFKKTKTSEAVYVYKGIEGFKNYLRDILDVGEDVYFIGAKGGWLDPRLKTFIRKFFKKAREKKINYHHIFDFEIKEDLEALKTLGKPYKFLPSKYSSSGAIDIFGDHVVTFSGLGLKTLTDDVTLAVIINRELADCYRNWFKFIWDHC